jgi:hypothetical protein
MWVQSTSPYSIFVAHWSGSDVSMSSLGYSHLGRLVQLSSRGPPSTISSFMTRTVPDHTSESV